MSNNTFVIDPNGTDCYGKYDLNQVPDYLPDDEVVFVDNPDDYAVVEWRYEDEL